MKRSMGMMSCEEVLARLWAFVDGELSPDEEAAVKAHLDLCERCFPEYNFRRAYFEFTRRLRELDHAAPTLRRRLFEKILEREANEGTAS